MIHILVFIYIIFLFTSALRKINMTGHCADRNDSCPKKNEPLDFRIPRTSRADFPNNNIPGTSRSSLNRQISRSSFYQLDVQKTIDLINIFKEKGLAGLIEDKNILSFRTTVNSLESYQMMKKILKPDVKLWYTETLTRPSIVNDLKDLKGKYFYFNDLTLLSDIAPADIIPLRKAKFTFKTEVRYHMEFDSEFGYVDLGALHNKFKNQYIVFPDVQFFVKDTEFFNGKEILVFKLQQTKISKDDWLKTREKHNKIVSINEIRQETKRSEIIEINAFFVSSKTPLKKFTNIKEIMKNYILRMDDTAVGSAPTYETLAREIYAGSINSVSLIPYHFNKWKITNSKYVNDVLYHKTLHQIDYRC
ncbi:uncharacterized protein LOC122512867 isoform X1 [Leptopilina heterotoma]|uniref:uncharacterized protein LOC122512867 isoform X1 n=1 Tax=Leptopilina heterotoma TaxID=63436 RepID=UPI001CA9BD29|nr:uncharacterized protein LOC122512867 isoform X1 [Leptopilina heterotoma]XP_043484907.1 uncharacterized protein LOC122512867 isoform X1 [Leptopilina heterotoma]XP_043484908.1 uncharacterized protein LOC122512867 isoform X1 [Leptopilina heterotoma]XP_043484909.1 uncharacterized protein LOC122512867 isoform X1 [Leptopilina heterotoma]XP_043484910.1 uncharacterized protein LOC122512867 isoform X1 [Leptopilina heterotoma]XP_043484911.1 uncharacterized protein LOC122512867 isoform X1 [Leptopilina